MFVIARHSKIKSTGELRAALKHNCREQNTPNADPSKTPLNGGDNVTVDGAMGKYRQLLGDHKARKNAVHAVEYMFSASPEWFKDKDRTQVLDYLRDCTNYVRDKFTAQNVISVRYHFDETTPHAHVIVIPMHQGKLNAKHYIGGSRAVAQQFQQDIGKLGQRHGLQRGQQGSKASHTTIQEFYATASQDQRDIVALALKAKGQKNAERINGAALTTAAKAMKEANKKAGQYHAQLGGIKTQLAETKSLLKQVKADHAKALKDATMSHDKEARKLRGEIDQLNKQVVALTNDRNRWKTRAKKADENAEKLWLEKNAKYLENLEKDRYANRKNRRENEKKAEYLELESATLSREREELEETKDRLYAKHDELNERLDQTVTLSHETVEIPQTLDPAARKKLLAGLRDVIHQHEKDENQKAFLKAAKQAAQTHSNPDPLHTPSPEPEKRQKRKSGPTMG